MKNNPIPRLDNQPHIRELLLPHCRLRRGDVWVDPISGHRVGCLDATNSDDVAKLMDGQKATLAIHDPPYNLIAFAESSVVDFTAWCERWARNTVNSLAPDASLYVWLGADQRNGFQPLPDFMIMMRSLPVTTRSFITMRNQRGYGTQKNWMAVRQELLYYTIGSPVFNVEAEYTDIPKILRGYYKEVNGAVTDNMERSKSENIRAGNVWVDIQQVFYRMDENVSGCYAQKPLKCIDRIVKASSNAGDLVVDYFAHSGTTLLSCEIFKRRCLTMDTDPIFCELTIRRLEHYRKTGRLGWQNGHAFEDNIQGQFEPIPDEALSIEAETGELDPGIDEQPRPSRKGSSKASQTLVQTDLF
jgi:site-specific DNA-methyltransferase (adenine-specific)